MMGVTCINSIFYPPHLHDPRIPLLSFFIISSIKKSPSAAFLVFLEPVKKVTVQAKGIVAEIPGGTGVSPVL